MIKLQDVLDTYVNNPNVIYDNYVKTFTKSNNKTKNPIRNPSPKSKRKSFNLNTFMIDSKPFFNIVPTLLK